MKRVIVPLAPAQFFAGSSALIRHSMAWPRGLMSRLRDRQRLARGDADHQLDQVEAGRRLGDRVLHLDARVHLHEVEVLVGSTRNSIVPALS